ncbi:MAG: hypothetical protein IT379_12805 [Deltaproteobacteria bacterium]|nr:hypothetical protein [Deltaproteobacteria bacterium]
MAAALRDRARRTQVPVGRHKVIRRTGERELERRCNRPRDRDGDSPLVQIGLVIELARLPEENLVQRLNELPNVLAKKGGKHAGGGGLTLDGSHDDERTRVVAGGIEGEPGNEGMEAARARGACVRPMHLLKKRCRLFKCLHSLRAIVRLDHAATRGEQPVCGERDLVVEVPIEVGEVRQLFAHFVKNVLRVRLGKEVGDPR